MVDQKILDSLGLGMAILYSSKGLVCAQNFDKVLNAFSPLRGNVDPDTRGAMADGFNLWGLVAPIPLKNQTLHEHKEQIYTLIVELIKEGIDAYDPNGDDEYKGNVYIANRLAHALLHAGQSDSSMELMAEISPFAFKTIEEILPFCSKFEIKSTRNFRDNPSTLRTDLMEALIHTIPSSPPAHSHFELQNAFVKVIYPILSGTNHAKIKAILPHKLKQVAEAVVIVLAKVSESSIALYSKELFDLVKNHGCHSLLPLFGSCLPLYYNNPQFIHDNIDDFIDAICFRDGFILDQSLTNNNSNHIHFPKICCYTLMLPLFLSIAGDCPKLFVPHILFFIKYLPNEDPGALVSTLTILRKIAQYSPFSIHSHVEEILKFGECFNTTILATGMEMLLLMDLLMDVFPLGTGEEKKRITIFILKVLERIITVSSRRVDLIEATIVIIHKLSLIWNGVLDLLQSRHAILSSCKDYVMLHSDAWKILNDW